MDALQIGTPTEDAQGLLSPTPSAPVLMPAHLDLLSRTRPGAVPDGDIALFLHGEADAADVQLLWRADVATDADDLMVSRILTAVPPRPRELLPLPLPAARAWLAKREDVDTSDVEAGDVKSHTEATAQRVAWTWDGERAVRVGAETRIRPGALVVVASAEGGCDPFGWNPWRTGTAPVRDVGDAASEPYASRSVAFRLHRALLEQEMRDDRDDLTDAERATVVDALWRRVRHELDAAGDAADAKGVIARVCEIDGLPKAWMKRLAAIRDRARGKVELRRAYGAGDRDGAAIVVATRGLRAEDIAGGESELVSATETDDLGSFSGRQSLVVHSGMVRDRAGAFARAAGLPEPLIEDVALAGYLHDVGKSDRRFQMLLAGARWYHGEILAKSGRSPGADERYLRRLAGLPRRWRHEVLSVQLAQQLPAFSAAHDRELVLWLIGTHHGFGRPLFEHDDPETDRECSFPDVLGRAVAVGPGGSPHAIDFAVRVESAAGTREIGWVDLFNRLQGRYGWWGLARLEAFVRLADHRASEDHPVDQPAAAADTEVA